LSTPGSGNDETVFLTRSVLGASGLMHSGFTTKKLGGYWYGGAVGCGFGRETPAPTVRGQARSTRATAMISERVLIVASSVTQV